MKRITSIFLSLCMIISCMAGLSFTAEASPVAITSWAMLQEAFDAGGTVTLTQNITAESTDRALTISADKTVTLDLNGKTIDRGLTEAGNEGNVITVFGELTVTDNSTGTPGKTTGGKNTNDGGGVFVSQGTFNVSGGTISGNTTDGSGRLVSAQGKGLL